MPYAVYSLSDPHLVASIVARFYTLKPDPATKLTRLELDQFTHGVMAVCILTCLPRRHKQDRSIVIMHMIPYTRSEEMPATLPPAQLIPIGSGEFSAVHISIVASALNAFLDDVEAWFDDRDEVILVDSGVSSKQNVGYIVLEWEECQVDALFLKILKRTPFIVDYAVYVRSEEVG